MLVVPAYAKVNLALEVLGLRPDGFHEIATVVQAIDWHDVVGVRLAGSPDGERVRLRLAGGAPGVPGGSDNLAHRAAILLLEAQPDPRIAADVWLVKRIPIAAGLGGGSADAAAVLRAGAALLAARGLRPAPETILDIASRLGSDVPALVTGGAVLATGRGERLRPLAALETHLAVAVAAECATAAAYAALTDGERRGDGRAGRVAAALEAATRPASGDCGSGIEPGAIRAVPSLRAALARLRAATPQSPWHLTGSGGAAFALAASAAEARELAGAARALGMPARPCRTVPAALVPVCPA